MFGVVEADEEEDGGVTLGDLFESLAEQLVSGGRLGELQLGGGGLESVVEKDGVVSIARGVDADADGDGAGGRLRSVSVVG